MVEVETLSSDRVMLSRSSTVVWPPPTSHTASLPISRTPLIREVMTDGDGQPYEISLVPPPTVSTFRSPYAGESFEAALQILHLFRGLHPSYTGSALPGPFRVTMTTLQDSLYGTDCGFAPLSQRDTPLQHLRSPRSTGSRLYGSLAITTTGLAPVS